MVFRSDEADDDYLRWSNTKNIIFLSLMLSDYSFTMLLCELPWLKIAYVSFPDLLIVMVAVVTRTVSPMLEFQQFCMHDFEWVLMIETWDKFFLVTQDNI